MYGLNGMNSHLTKNSEWGAVAYLCHSKYGLNANTSNNKEVTINSKNLGNSPSTVYAATSYGNANTPNDVNASTTKNMTGIFDLSGGTFEYTAGYYKGGSCSSNPAYHSAMASSSTSASTRLVTLYETANKMGDGMNVSEMAGWNNDYVDFVNANIPVAMRGCNYIGGDGAGIFAFDNWRGEPNATIRFPRCSHPIALGQNTQLLYNISIITERGHFYRITKM